MDEYEAYLREIVEWCTSRWRQTSADISARYSLECYEDALEQYLKFKAKRDDHYQLLLQVERTQDIIRELQAQVSGAARDSEE